MTYRIAAGFFCISLAYSIGWTAVSSMLATFKLMYGPASYLRLNLAYFLPTIPVVLVQARYDHKLNGRFGMARTTVFRMVIGLGSSAVVCALLPFLMQAEKQLLVCVIVLGIGSAIAFSSSYQLVSYFPTSCNVALSAGFVGGGPIVFSLEVAARLGPHAKLWQAELLYWISCALTFLGLGAALVLIHQYWTHLAESSGTSAVDKEPLLPSILKSSLLSAGVRPTSSKDNTPPASPRAFSHSSPPPSSHFSVEDGQADSESSVETVDSFVGEILTRPHSGSPGSSLVATSKAVWPAAVALFLSIGASMLVAPFFTYVPSSGLLGDMLPQALFAARVWSDMGGRFIPVAPCMKTKAGLLIASIFRATVTPIFFWYIKSAQQYDMLNDVAAVAGIALFWATSGHLNACAYLMGAAWAPVGAKEKQGGLMVFVFQMSCFLSLLCAVGVQHVGFLLT